MGRFSPGTKTGVVTLTATGAVTSSDHSGVGKTLLLGEVGGNAELAVTLPAAAGTGDMYRFIVTVTQATGENYIIKVANGDDTITGQVRILDMDGTTISAYSAGGTDDTITIDANSGTGGRIGDWVEFIDIATNKWMIRGDLRAAAGTNPADPFSASVS